MTEEKEEKSAEQIRKEKEEERDLIRASLKDELDIIRKNRVFAALLELVDRKKNEHLTIDKIKPDKDAASQYFFCKGVVDLARKLQGFIKDIENGTVNVHFWDKAEGGRDR